jgi:hypothetical protein
VLERESKEIKKAPQKIVGLNIAMINLTNTLKILRLSNDLRIPAGQAQP